MFSGLLNPLERGNATQLCCHQQAAGRQQAFDLQQAAGRQHVAGFRQTAWSTTGWCSLRLHTAGYQQAVSFDLVVIR